MANADGYRKSASKPVIKNILPNSKVPMITLIELNEVDPWYTFDLIINEAQKDSSYTPEKQAKDIEKIISGKLVLFIFPNCDKCTSLHR